MDGNKFEVIQQLMDELKKEMQYSPDELGERLGRKKPDVEVLKIEGDMPMDGEEMPEEMGDMSSMMDEEMSPEEKLKKRLMKMRG